MSATGPGTAHSGRDPGTVDLEAVRAGDVTMDDLRISAATLEAQAGVAERHGNPQLAANLRRASELTQMADARVLAVYEALRPGRSSADELAAVAAELAAAGASRTAALVREAAAAYARRGLLRP